MLAQGFGLRRVFSSGITTVRRDEITWRGDLSPDDYGRTYDVELRYHRHANPAVWVREPDLHALTGGRRLPHVYSQAEQKLCLCVPGCGFWRPDRALSQTVLPWTCYWLRLFELWLVTDTWHEHGVHPEPPPRRKQTPGTILF
jgi:hypothetical protein